MQEEGTAEAMNSHSPAKGLDDIKDSIEAGLVRTQMDDAVSADIKDSIKAGLMGTQMQSTVDIKVLDSIKPGVEPTQLDGPTKADLADSVKSMLGRASLHGIVRQSEERFKAGLVRAPMQDLNWSSFSSRPPPSF